MNRDRERVNTTPTPYGPPGAAWVETYGPRDKGCSCAAGPYCTAPGKHPVSSGWQKHGTRDQSQVDQWLARGRNVAVLTGKTSGLVALDIDPRNGGDNSLAELVHQHGPLPKTYTVQTGGGGWHAYFIHPGGAVGNRILGPGVEIKGDGGSLTAPGSLHVSGGRYRVRRDGAVAALPPAWLRLVAQPAPNAAPAVEGDIPEGERSRTLVSLGGTMRRRGMTLEAIEAALLAENGRCSPPLGEAEVRAIARSVSRYRPPDRRPAPTGDTGYGSRNPENSRNVGVVQPAPPTRKPFPVDALPPACRRLVEQGAKARGVDPAFLGVLALPALAGAIGNSRILRVKSSYAEPAIIWAALVSPSGTMKSAMLDDTLGPHREKDRELVEKAKTELANYESEMFRYKAGQTAIRPTRPACHAVLVNDVTVEALALRLSDNPRGLLLGRDELSGWIGSFDAYKRSNGADVGSYLEMHRGGVVKVDRKRSDQPTIYVPRAALSVAGTIQPRILARAIGQEGKDNGLLARLLVAMPPPAFAKWTEDDVDEATYSGYRRVIESLLNLSGHPDTGDPIELALSAEARDLWRPYHDRMMNEASTAGTDLAAAYAKLRGGALRFALVLALARDAGATQVDAEAMRAGIRLAEWFANEADRVYASFTETDEQREARRLVEWIEGRGGVVTVRDLVTYGPRPRFPGAEEAEKFLQRLAHLGLGSLEYPDPDPKGGRPPSARFTVTVGCKTTELPENHEVLLPQPETGEGRNGHPGTDPCPEPIPSDVAALEAHLRDGWVPGRSS